MPDTEIKVRDLPPNERADLLKRSALDVQVASVKGDTDNKAAFFGAHARTASYAVLVFKDQVTVWEITGGTEPERRARVQSVRDLWMD